MAAILFVCLGNICRSPLAEGILRRKAQEAGIELRIDSAGIGDWHVGDLPDHRAIKEGHSRGCDMSMRARQFRTQDFEEFDWIIAMDLANVQALNRWPGSRPKIRLARSFDKSATGLEVPDPYYGTKDNFVEVADMLEVACDGILKELADSEEQVSFVA